MKIQKELPPIGARIIKSSAAVVLCMILYYVRTLLPVGNRIPFYSALAALWCMQPNPDITKSMALQRCAGTFIGAVYGLAFLIVIRALAMPPQIIVYLAAAVMIIPIIYTTVLIKKKNASFFSCVVFLSIALTHSFDSEPFIFVFNRVLDTLIGIGVGVGVNTFRIRKIHDTETLYISGIDSVLISDNPYSLPYSKVELNRLLSDGDKFTISTIHTPAELIPIMNGVDLKLPVIVMDGAAVYNIRENNYICAHFLDSSVCGRIEELFSESEIHCFVNILYDHTLIVYYPELTNSAEMKYFDDRRRSPYSNFVDSTYRNTGHSDKVLYLMGLDETDKINKFSEKISSVFSESVRMTVSDSEYAGYSYIKIYSPFASKQEMIKKYPLTQKLKMS